jgi:hypothetical protein
LKDSSSNASMLSVCLGTGENNFRLTLLVRETRQQNFLKEP